jgi:hypothetical protein
MIFFVTPRDATWSMEDYLRRKEAGAMGDRVRVLCYEDLFAQPDLPIGSYVFAALDQLTPTGNEIVARYVKALAGGMPGIRLLNDPGAILHRYELLQKAFETGRNGFRVTRASALKRRHRFPVFLRDEREHTGSLTPLINSPWALDRALIAASIRGHRLRDVLVVEYCDTSDEAGLYRKYSAFVIGDRIVPRALAHSRDWVTKDHDRIISDETAQEELHYVAENPHESWLRETFRLAGTDYGRIDYGLVDGRPQLWEINLNPTIGRRTGPLASTHRTDAQRTMLEPARTHFYKSFTEAFQRLDCPDTSRTISVAVSAAERARLRAEYRKFAQVRSRKTALSRVLHPPARFLKRALGLGARGATATP